MFDNLLRELRRIENTTSISVPLESDAEGYCDKECPAETCLFQFKIHEDDWKALVRDEEVFCPSCRNSAPAKSWFTTEQIEYAKQYAFNKIKNQINGAMRADAAASQRRRQDSFLKITLEVKGGRDAVLLPVAAAEPMRLRTKCEKCGCRYSFVGAAYFCPSCGANSANHTFAQTIAAIRIAVKVASTLRETLAPDEAEVLKRTLLEKAKQDAVTSFQRFAEQLYETKTGEAARRNVFQNLEIGSNLWARSVGNSYEQMIGVADLERLRVYYQQRHLLAHQQGIVDADYIARSGDTEYTIGQRLIIRECDVLDFANLVERLGTELSKRCAS